MITMIDTHTIDRTIEQCRNREWRFTDDRAVKARNLLRDYCNDHIEPESHDEFMALADAKIHAALQADAQQEPTA